MKAAFLFREFASLKAALPAKGKAAGIHVSISLVIFFVLLYLIVFKWYPQPFFATDGGWQGLRLMFGVDVVLGPVLTFVVFNPAKRRAELVRDLSFVAVVQLSALAWGIHTVHGERPVAVVEYDGTFRAVTSAMYAVQEVDPATLSRFDARQPPVIFQRLAEGDETRKSIQLANAGAVLRAQVFLYERFDQNLPKVFEQAAAYEAKVTEKRPELKPEFQRMREKYGSDAGFLPFMGRHGNAAVVITRGGEMVDSIRL